MSERTVLIVQARMRSTRLPGKSLMDLAGAPLVQRIIERIKRCQAFDAIVLAVPAGDADDPLAALGAAMQIEVFRGAENDCLDRYYQAAKRSGATLVGRLPADNATPEPEEMDRIVRHHRSLGRPGFSSNLAQVFGNEYPDGIGCEVFDFTLLEQAWERNTAERQREHVHLNFFDYATQTPVDPSWCPVTTVKCPVEFRRPDLVLDVNTPEQYEFMRELYGYLYPRNPTFHITDIIRWYDGVYRKRSSPAAQLTV